MSEGDKATLPYWLRLLLRIFGAIWWFMIFASYMNASRGGSLILFAGLCLIVGAFVSTLVHEAGHAVAALARGWRIIAFVVRPIAWQVPNRDLVMLPRRFKQHSSGWLVTVPRQADPDAKAQWSTIIAAGPIASLALALIAFFVCWIFSDQPYRTGIAISSVALGLGLQALNACVFTILPSTIAGVVTDGDQWRALRRADSGYALNRSLKWCHTLLHYDVRLRDLPEWMLAGVGEAPDRSADTLKWLATVRIGQVLDSSRVDALLARRLIDEFRAAHESSEWLAACDAYLAAMWEVDLDRARTSLAERADLPVTLAIFMAAEAAVAARAGEQGVARTKIKAMAATRRRESPFRDFTFGDIRAQIEALLV